MQHNDWRTGPEIAKNTNTPWACRLVYDDEDNGPMTEEMAARPWRQEEQHEEKPGI